MLKASTNIKGGIDYILMTEEEEQFFLSQTSIVANWTYPNRPIRINLTDEQYIALLIDYPDFAVIRQRLAIPVEANGMGGEYLYLEELYDDDRQLFLYFGGVIENKP